MLYNQKSSAIDRNVTKYLYFPSLLPDGFVEQGMGRDGGRYPKIATGIKCVLIKVNCCRLGKEGRLCKLSHVVRTGCRENEFISRYDTMRRNFLRETICDTIFPCLIYCSRAVQYFEIDSIVSVNKMLYVVLNENSK